MTEHAHVATISAQEYLEGEKHAQVRHEYVAGQVFAMGGATRTHNRIASRLLEALDRHLEGGPCEVYISDVKVRVEAADAYYYPDVAVTCDPTDRDEQVLQRPCLVVEVLSDSTESVDRREKRVNYRSVPSIREYVLIAQDRQRVEVYRRESADAWSVEVCGEGESVHLASVGVTVEVSALYVRRA